MASSASFYLYGLQHICSDVNFADNSTTTIKALQTSSSYSPAQDTHQWLTDVTNEVGVRFVVTGRTVSVASPLVIFNCASPLTNSSITETARRIVFFKDTGTAGTSPLLFWQDAGVDIASTSPGNWQFTVDATGLAAIPRS